MAIINVTAGMSLQTAIDTAQPGDVISVEAGATFRGPIELPWKIGEAEIVVQSSRVVDLPQARINPSHSPLMPKILALDATQADNNQAIRTKPGAHHYKLDGIECVADINAITLYDLVRLGGNRHEQKTLDSVPHHLTLDRMYVHGRPESNFQRGISLDSKQSTITRSYISDVHGRGMDSQAIWLHNTPGGNDIIDCYLEAAGENVMFGGADPFSSEFIPSDCRMLQCDFFKPLAWMGKGWTDKNLLEFKGARRIVVDGCTFENNWGGEGQDGHSILFTVRNQDGTAPYSVVEDITISNFILRNVEAGFNFLGTDNEKPSGKTSNIKILNGLIHGVRSRLITINGTDDLTFDHNTCMVLGSVITAYSTPSLRARFRRNIFGFGRNGFGLFGDGGAMGSSMITQWMPGAEVAENVFTGLDQSSYPANNFYPKTDAEIGFFDLAVNNYKLATASQFRAKGSDGKDLGVDIDALMAAQSGATTAPSPSPIPPAPKPASPDGTKAVTIVDASGGEWTISPNMATLRNGEHMDRGQGTIYKWLGGVVYVQGNDTKWYKWMQTFWSLFGLTEPGVTPPVPTPIPTPVPVPPPVPAPLPATRSVSWPAATKQDKQRNAILDAQWREKYRLRSVSGSTATFERVG